MRAMNGLTHNEISRLKRRMERSEDDVRKLLQAEFSRRAAADGTMPYRESVDGEAIANAFNDPTRPLIIGCVATREAIERSMDAMRAGTYGACEDCGRHIGLKQLLSQPTATRCVHCDAKRMRTDHVPSPRN